MVGTTAFDEVVWWVDEEVTVVFTTALLLLVGGSCAWLATAEVGKAELLAALAILLLLLTALHRLVVERLRADPVLVLPMTMCAGGIMSDSGCGTVYPNRAAKPR